MSGNEQRRRGVSTTAEASQAAAPTEVAGGGKRAWSMADEASGDGGQGRGGHEDLWTVKRLLNWCVPWLGKQGVDSARLDGELLLAHALDLRRIDLFMDPGRPLDKAELARFKGLIQRRAQREPVAYILGQRDFWKHTFRVGKGVLIPRPESEIIIQAVLDRLAEKDQTLDLLDIGVGSGALLLSLLAEYPQARGTGIDAMPKPLEISRINGESLGLSDRLTLLQGDLFTPLDVDERFDIILSNPPYVATGDWANLAPEITRHEPREALLSGTDGLDLMRRLVPLAVDRLKERGLLVVEIGHDQGKAVAALFSRAGLNHVTVLPDFAGLDRVVVGDRCVNST